MDNSARGNHGLHSHAVLRLVSASSAQAQADRRGLPHSLRGYLPVLGGIVVFLMLIHFTEAFIRAVFYVAWGGLPDFETALYFSLISYTIIGYGNVLLAQPMRLVGVSEELTGTFMCGWSVAVLQEIARDSVTRITSGLNRKSAQQ